MANDNTPPGGIELFPNETTEEVDISQVVDSAGIPIIEMTMDPSADTQKIELSELDTAMMVDNAFLSGVHEGKLFGQFELLDLVYKVLLRANLYPVEAQDIIRIIAKHAGILDAFNLRKNNFKID